MKLKDQEILYAYLEGRHCADDEWRDNGGFYIFMNSLIGRDPDQWQMFTNGYYERMEQNGISNH